MCIFLHVEDEARRVLYCERYSVLVPVVQPYTLRCQLCPRQVICHIEQIPGEISNTCTCITKYKYIQVCHIYKIHIIMNS